MISGGKGKGAVLPYVASSFDVCDMITFQWRMKRAVFEGLEQ